MAFSPEIQKNLVRAAAITGVMAAALGCLSIEQMAPLVEGHVAHFGIQNGAPHPQLLRGRELYVTQCIRCHTVEPVNRYSLEEWAEILPEMAKETKLTRADMQALRSYIHAAHAAMSLPPETPPAH